MSRDYSAFWTAHFLNVHFWNAYFRRPFGPSTLTQHRLLKTTPENYIYCKNETLPESIFFFSCSNNKIDSCNGSRQSFEFCLKRASPIPPFAFHNPWANQNINYQALFFGEIKKPFLIDEILISSKVVSAVLKASNACGSLFNFK